MFGLSYLRRYGPLINVGILFLLGLLQAYGCLMKFGSHRINGVLVNGGGPLACSGWLLWQGSLHCDGMLDTPDYLFQDDPLHPSGFLRITDILWVILKNEVRLTRKGALASLAHFCLLGVSSDKRFVSSKEYSFLFWLA